MEKLKALFGTDALTFEQLEEKLKDNKEVKLANLASGEYVGKKKFDDLERELKTANDTISGLQDTVKKFDGVDVEELKKSVADWKTKYDTDIDAVQTESLLFQEAVRRKAKNPQMVLKMLDRSLIKRDGEKLIGASEQFDALEVSDAYAFGVEEQTKGPTVNTGGNHGGNTNIDTFTAALYKGAGLETKGE